jgi:hypothetical protein
MAFGLTASSLLIPSRSSDLMRNEVLKSALALEGERQVVAMAERRRSGARAGKERGKHEEGERDGCEGKDAKVRFRNTCTPLCVTSHNTI